MKISKRILVTVLSIFSLAFIFPNVLPIPGNISVVEAATSLNQKNVILTKGDKFTLKLTGTKKKIKWTSNKPEIVSVNNGKITAKKTGTAKISAVVGKKTYYCTVKVMSKEDINSKLIDAYNWQCTDIWNNGFCDIYHYIEHGSGSVGQKLNINKTISNVKKSLKSKTKYNNFVKQLQGSKYKKYKKTWTTLYSEMLKLEKCLNKGTPKPYSDFYFPYEKYQENIYQLLSDVSEFY